MPVLAPVMSMTLPASEGMSVEGLKLEGFIVPEVEINGPHEVERT